MPVFGLSLEAPAALSPLSITQSDPLRIALAILASLTRTAWRDLIIARSKHLSNNDRFPVVHNSDSDDALEGIFIVLSSNVLLVDSPTCL